MSWWHICVRLPCVDGFAEQANRASQVGTHDIQS